VTGIAGAPTLALLGWEGWGLVRAIALALVGLFWLAVGYWTFKDARRRIASPWLVAAATLVGLVPPFLGALVYMLFRPPEYLDEVRERELEMRALQRLRGPEERCPVCRSAVEPSFLVCPVCTTRLREPCVSCQAPLERLWQVCPYCETPVVRRPLLGLGETEGPPPRPRPARRKRGSAGE
jgi:hypothetical protein